MRPARAILLASHGTAGARAAERMALDLCARGGRLHHLVVIPDFWKGMLGDDWLNNAVTQIRFGHYVEGQLEREVGEQVARLEAKIRARGLGHSHETALGDPAECLIVAAERRPPDLVIIGAPRPKGVIGYRSRMDVETLIRRLRAPLLIVPFAPR